MKKYNNGCDFVDDLVKDFGLLDGYRKATDYLAIQKDAEDPEEKSFCKEIETALWKLDQI